MKPITQAQTNYIRSLLTKLQLLGYVDEVAMAFSNERTTNIHEFTIQEASDLIKQLTSDNKPDPCNIMRRKIISMAREMGWSKKTTTWVADMERIENWCKQYSYLHKQLNDYTFDELPKLVAQFGQFHKEFLKEY
jgi:hypothetical protein